MTVPVEVIQRPRFDNSRLRPHAGEEMTVDVVDKTGSVIGGADVEGHEDRIVVTGVSPSVAEQLGDDIRLSGYWERRDGEVMDLLNFMVDRRSSFSTEPQ